jgi:hypothetical protein
MRGVNRCSLAVLVAVFAQCNCAGGMRASSPGAEVATMDFDGEEIDWAMMREEMNKHIGGAERRHKEEFGIADQDGNDSVDIAVRVCCTPHQFHPFFSQEFVSYFNATRFHTHFQEKHDDRAKVNKNGFSFDSDGEPTIGQILSCPMCQHNWVLSRAFSCE